jgi:hypothetical protein
MHTLMVDSYGNYFC